jgi:hypothetical protein
MGRLRLLDPVMESSLPAVPNFLHYFVPGTLALSIVCQAPTTKAEWRTFNPPGKGFSISMPGEPKFTPHDSPNSGMYLVDLSRATEVL